MRVISEGLVDSPSFIQARREAIRLQAMEEQFSWMTEADQYMLHLGLEPVPWEHVAEATGQKGESQFQAIEQRVTGKDVLESQEELAPNSLVGATIVIRSETVVSAFRRVSNALQAESATTEILSTVVKALPQGDALDLIVWKDQYCQDPGWKGVMTVWKAQKINTAIRMFEEEGEDAESGPFQALALREAIQAVKDGMQERNLPVEGE
jgi:hypothetical protein